MNKTPNLYLPGLRPDGTPRTLIELPGYWKNVGSQQARGGRGDAYLPELLSHLLDQAGVAALVQLDQIDTATGRVLARTLTHNVVTDAGAQTMLKGFGSGGAGSLGQYMVLDIGSAASQVNSAITANASLTAGGITVVAGGNAGTVAGNKAAAFNGNTTNTPCTGTAGIAGAADTVTGGGVVLGYGLGTADYVSASATMTATNIGVAAGQVKNAHALNEWVIALPQVTDGLTNTFVSAVMYNSGSSTAGATGTALAAAPSGTGIGLRQAQFIATFTTTSTAGGYTGLWIVTAATLAATTAAGCYTHLSFNPQTINGTTSLQVTYTIKV